MKSLRVLILMACVMLCGTVINADPSSTNEVVTVAPDVFCPTCIPICPPICPDAGGR